MSRSGAGIYTLPGGINPVVAGTVIQDTWANPTLDDVATALTQSIASTGVTAITANLPMSSFKHTGAAAATASGQYLVYAQAAAVLAGLKVEAATLPRIAIISVDSSVNTLAFQKSATWNYEIVADTTSLRMGVVGVVTDALEILASGYARANTRFAINSKTPVAAVAAPAVATDLATALTLVNDMRTRLINFGIYI